MIRAIFFDLDGTLTLMDQELFMKNYIGLLAPRFNSMISSEKFAKQMARSLEVMQNAPQKGKTNFQTFVEDFTKGTGLTQGTIWPIFEDFYKHEFPDLRCLVKLSPNSKEVVEAAKNEGYLVGIGANPVMPIIAMEERVRWAELSPENFDLVPSIETFHYCKPHPGFFQELAENLNLEPQECLMVGNHPIEDLAALEVGMSTFYVGEK
ncbi:MAG: HAD family hydrolase, partial [Desulfitobacterium sp.]|nr:HAD family hydrolase [Desulfitobacterium sp.]